MNAWPREKWHCDNFELLLMNQSVIAKDDGLMAKINISCICTLSMDAIIVNDLVFIVIVEILNIPMPASKPSFLAITR